MFWFFPRNNYLPKLDSGYVFKRGDRGCGYYVDRKIRDDVGKNIVIPFFVKFFEKINSILFFDLSESTSYSGSLNENGSKYISNSVITSIQEGSKLPLKVPILPSQNQQSGVIFGRSSDFGESRTSALGTDSLSLKCGTPDIFSAMISYYEMVDKSKANSETVNKALGKYAGNEETMIALLERKYGRSFPSYRKGDRSSTLMSSSSLSFTSPNYDRKFFSASMFGDGFGKVLIYLIFCRHSSFEMLY